MNLMFRKNFKEQKSGGGSGKGVKGTVGRHTNKRCTREQGYTPIEEHHYRTHLFFSPPRSGYNPDESDEPRCGPMTCAVRESSALTAAVSPAMTETDVPQSLLCRSQSVNVKWLPNPSYKTTPFRQTSFNNGNSELMRSVCNLEKDCFIIPIHSLDRFLPAGVPMPKSPSCKSSTTNNNNNSSGNLEIMEVPDPKLCVLCHLMSHLEPIDPILESPLIQPLSKQRILATELINEIAATYSVANGALLANMEKNAEFPFISIFIINTTQINPITFYNNLRTASLAKFDPRIIRYTAAHTLDLYSEVASICRPPIYEIGLPLSKTQCATTGYIISVYKVLEGDDREKFERNWLYWTGARMIYRYLPEKAGLMKISLHKSLTPKGDKMYILLCECANLLQDITVCALLLPALRARLTGYTGLFRPLQTF